MRQVAILIAAVFVWDGCFSVDLPQTYHCSASNPECPEGQVCQGGVCVKKGTQLDGALDSPSPDVSKPDATKPDTTKPDTTKPDSAPPDLPPPDQPVPDLGPPDWLFKPDGCVRTCMHKICSSYVDYCPADPCFCGCDGIQYQCHCGPTMCGSGTVGGNPGTVKCAQDLAFVTTYFKPGVGGSGWTCFLEPKKP